MKKVIVACFLATVVVVGFGANGLCFCAMRTLPLGSIRPEGHLRERLELQTRGLTGHAEELYDDIGHSDWLTNAGCGGQYSWERGPYYARGLIVLAFALGDNGLKEKARKWVEAALASQKESGDIGPQASYRLKDDDLYVRAKVVMPNGVAWTQPYSE